MSQMNLSIYYCQSNCLSVYCIVCLSAVYPSNCLPTHPSMYAVYPSSVFMPIYLSTIRPVNQSTIRLSFCPSIYLPSARLSTIRLSFCPSIYLPSARLSTHPSVFLPIYLSTIRPSINHPSVFLPIYLSAHPSIHLSVSLLI